MNWKLLLGTLIVSSVTTLAAYMKRRALKTFMKDHGITPPNTPEYKRFLENFKK